MDYLAIDQLNDSFVTCRTLGHSWDDNPNAEIASLLSNDYLMALRCVRCATERFDYLTVVGKLAQRYYRYPEGYAAMRNPKAAYRAEMISRSLLVHYFGKPTKRSRNGSGKQRTRTSKR